MSSATGPPLLWLGVDPKTAGDAERLARALAHLLVEDRNLHARTGPLGDSRTIGGGSELHLEIVVDRLKREFGVAACLGRPEVAYRAALTRTADGEARHTIQTSGHREYAHVKIRLNPGRPGSGSVFEDRLAGGTIPPQYIPAIEEGIHDALARGGVAGYPISDVRIELYDGSFDEVSSLGEAFRVAGCLAAEGAIREAGPIVLEPVMLVQVVVPVECRVDVVMNLGSRRGQVHAQEDAGETAIIRAAVPLADLFGYETDLRSRTYGRGTCTMQFEHYAPVQSIDDDEDRDSMVRAPLKPASPLGRSAIALPEPDDDAEW